MPRLPCGWAHQITAMPPITGPQSAILNHKVWGLVALSCEHATSSLVTRPVLELGQPSFDVTVVAKHGRGQTMRYGGGGAAVSPGTGEGGEAGQR
jgi:hypothetical protein